MKRNPMLLVMLALTVALGCGGSATETPAPAEEAVEQVAAEEPAVEARHDLIYICGCGPECECGAVSKDPGTCDCGSELVQTHMLMVDGNAASLCTCGGDCTCELDAEDPTKCGCDKPIKQVSLEGKGLYYCNCGGSCKCNFVASEPGTCSCGMELVTS
jgi:hypothetical protein